MLNVGHFDAGSKAPVDLLKTETGPSPLEAPAVPALDVFLGISPGSNFELIVAFVASGVDVVAALTGLELGTWAVVVTEVDVVETGWEMRDGVNAVLNDFGVDGFGVVGADGFALDGV